VKKRDVRPEFEQFLNAPLAEVASLAPATMIFAAGGTRRSAALAGVSLESDEYVHWTYSRMNACFALIFRHGVRHLFTFAIVSSQLNEITGVYRERLLEWVAWGLAGPQALADYRRLGWRVRLLGSEQLPALAPVAERLLAETAETSPHTLWWCVVPAPELQWQSLLATAQAAQARSQKEAIRALYGEDIPLASLYLAFGKPLVTPSLFPPLLVGEMHCYWSQRPGYTLTEREFRTILYDYAYLRHTWQTDKSGRAEAAVEHREAWEQGPILGLGTLLGPFWYPTLANPVTLQPLSLTSPRTKVGTHEPLD
jgi:hypothetical protein